MKEKKTNKFLGITLSISLLLTFVFGLATMFTAPNGGKLSNFWHSGNPFYWSVSSNSFDHSNDFEQDFTKINSVEIANSVSSVEIVASKTEHTHISYQGTYPIKVYQDHNTLEIDGELKSKSRFSFGINNDSGKLIVELGKDVQYLMIESGVGTHFIRGVDLHSLDIDDGVGTTTVTDVTLKNNLEIDGGVGNIDISDLTATNVEVNGGVGNIKLSGIKAKSIDLENGIGNISIKDSQTDYLSTSKGLGQLSIENVETKYPHNEYSD